MAVDSFWLFPAFTLAALPLGLMGGHG